MLCIMHVPWGVEATRLLGEAEPVVLDGFLGTEDALRARAAVVELRATGELEPASVGRGRTGRGVVRSDRMTWIEPSDPPEGLGPLVAAFHALRDAVNAQAWLGLGPVELQAACYPGGGVGYDWHRDAFHGPENRQLTAICYLNPDWEPAHGGLLHARGASGERIVEPVLGRLVVFLSAEVEHRVAPSTGPRFAVTSWFRRQGTLPGL